MTVLEATKIQINGHTYSVEIADTPEKQRKGLSFRASMPSDQGMLFVFSDEKTRPFWMYGMKFSLDIIWVASDGRVVGLSPNAQPIKDGQESNPPVYFSNIACRYVLELNSGEIDASEISVGTKILGLPRETTIVVIQKSLDIIKQESGSVAISADPGIFTPTFGTRKKDEKDPDYLSSLRNWLKKGMACAGCKDGCGCGSECDCDHHCTCPDLNLSQPMQELLFSAAEVDKMCNGFLKKAVIQTPMKDGKFDSGAVPKGASVWITVGDPESPLHGRHILLTKRPDGLFALTGGGGRKDDETSARRHMVLTGTPKKTKRDEELEQEIDEAKKFNEPLVVARKEAEKEARQQVGAAAGEMLSALGIKEQDKKQMLEKKDEIQKYVESVLGEDEKEKAKRITDAVMRQISNAEREIKQRVQVERQLNVTKVGKRLMRLKEGEQAPQLETEERQAIEIPLPDIEAIKDLTSEQQELEVARHFESGIEDYFSEDRPETSHEEETPKIELGTSVESLKLESPEQLKDAAQKVKNYWEKRGEAEQLTKRLRKVPLAQINPSTVASIKSELSLAPYQMDDAEIEARTEKEYEDWFFGNSAIALYDAVGEYWNDDRSLVDQISSKDKADTVMKFHIDAGASTALAAMAKEYIGVRIDAARLVKGSNIEVAANAVALEVRNSVKSADQYTAILEKVRAFNSENQVETERRALQRHGTLKTQYAEIQKQKSNAELVDRVRIASLEADNLIEQRRNLGAALGSLQASASFYDALARLKTAKDDLIQINVGSDEKDAQAIISRLGMKKGYVIDTSDPDNISIKAGITSLDRMMTIEKDNKRKFDRYESLKTNMGGVAEDENGNLVVEKYDVPGWKKQYADETGTSKDYKWRVEQRNDIEWLREATKKTSDNPNGQGGGLITRVVGAGKTNTALGFFAHKLAENKDYKGLVAVPKGRAQQWYDEAKKFTDLNVELIPDGTAREKVDEILAQIKPGTVCLIGHREAAKSAVTLEAMQTNHELGMKFDGLVIDEPQELQSRGQSGNIGALGRRIMKLPINHRVALTATPARRSPLEAYDLIRWTQDGAKEIGSKASFARTFSGFSSGTNSQDTAISKLYFDTIKPFISGDRLTRPDFKVRHNTIQMKRSQQQIERQKQIEAQSQEYISKRRNEIIQEVQANPNHSLRRMENWEGQIQRKATEIARKEVEEQHRENIEGGDYKNNSKLLALKSELEKGKDQKHVIFVDSKAQRSAMVEMLRDIGYNPNQIKNIASTTTSITGQEMAERVRDFKTNPKTNIIMIDRNSATGYNLQQGDLLHVVGTPGDAATYLQAQGRVARSPRKGDVGIKTYRYEDDASSMANWLDLDAQLKVLRASAPGMFVGQ